VHNVIE